MPKGTCLMRLQNSLSEKLLRYDVFASNAEWNQQPPMTVEAGASSGNFQLSYNYQDSGQADFHMRYSIHGAPTQVFTAAGIIETDPETHAVTLTPSGAGPGAHTVSWNVTGAHPHFFVLFTFN